MLELVGVSKQYLYGARVLGSLDMKIEDGKILALLGDELSGKTTFLKVVASVTDCEGKVLFDGEPIDKKPDDVIMVFDDLAMFENRTCYYNLAYPLIIRGYDKDRIKQIVNDCAEKTGVVAILYDKAKKTSLIDLKRLAIARLFLRPAKVILVDDITRGLDKDEARVLWSEVAPILQNMAREGKIVIFATRDKDEALSIADTIAVMHYGEVKQVGTYEQILANPSNVWAVQAFDNDYRFEKAHLDQKDGKLVATTLDNYDIDLSHLDGKIATGYIGKDVFVGWASDCYDVNGDRKESVQNSIRTRNGYELRTKSGVVHCKQMLDEVGTLPVQNCARVYDFASENSIMKDVL